MTATAFDLLQNLNESFASGDAGDEGIDVTPGHRPASEDEKDEDQSSRFSWTAFFIMVGQVGEFLAKAVSNGYWGVDLAHLIYEPKDENDPAHYVIYGVAGTFALTAAGAAYLHGLLNAYHNHPGEEKVSEPNEVVEPDIGSCSPKPKPKQPTKMQWLALATDYLTHIGETSGPLSFGFDQLTTSQGVQLPEWVRPVSILMLTLFGSLTAVADVRTCYDAMMGHGHDHHDHHAHHHDHTHADRWTKINAYGEAVSGVISNAAWGMDMAYLLYHLISETEDDNAPLFNVALYMVVGFFALTALASARIHMDLNIIHQHADTPETKKEDRLPLTTPQKIKLALDAVTHTGNVASPLSTQGYDQLAANVIKTPLPTWVNPAVKGGILVFSMFAAVPYVRTCDDAMGRKNKRDADEKKRQQEEQQVRPKYDTVVLTRSSLNG